MTLLRILASSALVAALTLSGAAAEPVRVAIFDFELIDTSLEGELNGPRADEAARIATLSDMLRAAFAHNSGYEVVDVTPVADEIARRHLQNCGGCDRSMAAELGADRAVTGTVQKVSNLILNINVYLRDVDGMAAEAHSVDIRGNTDESWRRGLSWLMRHRLDLDPGN
jgi:hypothetical protein